jgi:N-acetylglucosaminyl-diphospho-decaprenol L-rhamnosyltransferase
MPVVLLVSYSGALGGAERLLVDLALGLEGSLCLACPEGPLAEAARRKGVRVFPLRTRNLRLRGGATMRLFAAASLVAHRHEVRRIAAGLSPDLILAWGMRSAIACLLTRVGTCPIVFQHNDFLPRAAVGALVRAAAARADLVLALSTAIAADLDPNARLGPRLRVIHPGIDVERFLFSPPPDGPPEVLVLGALVGWKRPDVALEAVALARRRLPQLRLRFVGAPLSDAGEPLLARLRERASRPDLAGAVEFVGSVPEGSSELGRATCLLHCAEREPFGMAVLESLAAGRPAVVPASAGPAEIVEPSCGLLYPPGDASAAAAAILRVIESPERAAVMGARGRARVKEHFDAGAARRCYTGTLDSLLAGRARRLNGGSPPAPELAIVTVTHNSEHELGKLLASVDRHLPGTRVVVADSGSSDRSVALARGWRGRVTVIELGENVGFGRACNRALSEVVGPVVALLNPDVELIDGSLRDLAAEAARTDRPTRLLAPRVLLPDGTRQDSVHPRPTSAPDLIRALVPPGALPGSLSLALAPWQADEPRHVGWAVGCAVVSSAEALRRLGPFDERIFLYAEDLDLGLRAADAGVQTWFWPSVRVLHAGAHASVPAFGGEPFERLARARHDVVARRLGPRRSRLDDAAQAVTFRSRRRLKRMLGRSGIREQRQLEALALVRSEARRRRDGAAGPDR